MFGPVEMTEHLLAIARHFEAHRAEILGRWRTEVLDDPRLPTAESLPRTQFYDHIPQVLEKFEQVLVSIAGTPHAASEVEQPGEEAEAHGLQRWQQGYDLREVVVEWGCLHLCLSDELDRFHSVRQETPLPVMAKARRQLAKLCSNGISESVAMYFQLQQHEAAGHVRDLTSTLEVLKKLESQRAELWRQAAHDLRGGLSVVVSATEILGFERAPGMDENDIFMLLQQSVTSLRTILDDVLGLARLHAGHEQLQIKPFDVAQLMQDLCQNIRSLAEEQELFLNAAGPATLPVSGDSAKTLRIAQNLLINAIKYTQRGGITVTWGDSRQHDPERWMLTIQDTGPGFHSGPGAPIVEALEDATEEAREVDELAGKGQDWQTPTAEPPRKSTTPDRRPIHQEMGEGIGLSIVKRLCELLLASVEVESIPGKGTCFRVVFPRSYPSPEST